MRYQQVVVQQIAYELPPQVVDSDDLEARLAPCLTALRIPPGQLVAMTGITERRWWPKGHRLSDGAVAAAKRALAATGFAGEDIETLIWASVCREDYEPASACHVAAGIGVAPGCMLFDVSNACLGVLNAMVDLANRIELGQVRRGMIVACETSRPIVEATIARMNANPTMEGFKYGLATMTGGSGAIAVIMSHASVTAPAGTTPHRLHGGAVQTAPQHHELCRWGVSGSDLDALHETMHTDSVSVLQQGVELGQRTWRAFLAALEWQPEDVDKVICHQVGSGHREGILKLLGLRDDQDFSTFPYLGNIGTVSCPITAAIAGERGFLQPGHRVGWLGIGSGLNCLMLGLTW